ncbi:NADH-ubiquinone oxidoreductase chain 4L [Rhodomicrobium vannielii ATCC 17100]|jgi:multicomponent Na+:H+ antiporter subunit C|uniref:NADH-ubiquinone oxidoreductase chain 4L n=1 Tax=Rhodomicrobium vannielii (strain ATCC 17100 / DSM 162 / LMG 4299 / NCIMB 10020 / ATH 3.1.1) TaxID=648757 RepID=E3I3L6_RHOVT|nr:cation:proton antiporter subunit C [Rhodomicrobium vannielii]ADP70363.1 NADH-ubiquinone oxidoreductase chain 4L [Rhodomicrobium vannielii ATCC 17100]
MSLAFLYALSGVGLFCLGFHALIVRRHLLRKILAINVMGSGIFLLFVALGRRGLDVPTDPVPQAMVITGIVVAVSNTALALSLMLRVYASSERAEPPARDGG